MQWNGVILITMALLAASHVDAFFWDASEADETEAPSFAPVMQCQLCYAPVLENGIQSCVPTTGGACATGHMYCKNGRCEYYDQYTGLVTGFAIGIAGACAIGLGIIGVSIYCCCRRCPGCIGYRDRTLPAHRENMLGDNGNPIIIPMSANKASMAPLDDKHVELDPH